MRLNNRRRLFTGGILGTAVVVIVAAAASVNAAPSRAASRWNHVAMPTAASLSIAADDGQEPAMAAPIWKTLHLTELYSARYTFVDTGPKGDSIGDYGIFKDPVITQGGIRIGTIDAQCIAGYSNMCSGSIRIPGRGQITFDGITPLGFDIDHYAITGGTGVFAGVGGVLTIQFPNVNSAALTLALTK